MGPLFIFICIGFTSPQGYSPHLEPSQTNKQANQSTQSKLPDQSQAEKLSLSHM